MVASIYSREAVALEKCKERAKDIDRIKKHQKTIKKDPKLNSIQHRFLASCSRNISEIALPDYQKYLLSGSPKKRKGGRYTFYHAPQ